MCVSRPSGRFAAAPRYRAPPRVIPPPREGRSRRSRLAVRPIATRGRAAIVEFGREGRSAPGSSRKEDRAPRAEYRGGRGAVGSTASSGAHHCLPPPAPTAPPTPPHPPRRRRRRSWNRAPAARAVTPRAGSADILSRSSVVAAPTPTRRMTSTEHGMAGRLEVQFIRRIRRLSPRGSRRARPSSVMMILPPRRSGERDIDELHRSRWDHGSLS